MKMVNPGVIFLAQKIIHNDNFCIEDNLGEAIHIHWGNIRLDLTIKETIDLTEQLIDIMNLLVGKKGFDIRTIDSNYLYNHSDKLIGISSNDLICAEDEIKNVCKNKKKEILMCMETAIPLHLKKKNVVLKGAGEHTKELIKIWKDKVNIIGILSNNKAKIEGYKTLEYDSLSELDVDTIVVSSYRYRDEMLKELMKYIKNVEILDLYKYFDYLGIYGIEKEYYKYLYEDC